MACGSEKRGRVSWVTNFVCNSKCQCLPQGGTTIGCPNLRTTAFVLRYYRVWNVEQCELRAIEKLPNISEFYLWRARENWRIDGREDPEIID